MMVFLCVGEAAPLIAVAGVGYYLFKQVVLSAFIAQEFATGMAVLKSQAEKLGVSSFPSIPEVPSVLSKYVWFALVLICGAILLISVVRLIRDQLREG
jgi:ABC-type phosphate transport system permease subunit